MIEIELRVTADTPEEAAETVRCLRALRIASHVDHGEGERHLRAVPSGGEAS